MQSPAHSSSARRSKTVERWSEATWWLEVVADARSVRAEVLAQILDHMISRRQPLRERISSIGRAAVRTGS